MKACVEVLFNNFPKNKTLNEIKKVYFNNVTIFDTAEENLKHQQQKSCIIKFFERDERDILKYERHF